MNKMKTLAGVSLVAALIGGGIGYAAHGDNTSKQSSASTSATSLAGVADKANATGHNGADIMFAQQMMAHHSQAIDMAKMVSTQASSTKVKALASTIEAAQTPEINMMKAWLTDWNAPATGTSMNGMSGMDHGSNTPGMMSDSDMQKLSGLTGGAFDKMFLTMMIGHHNGAITMAKDEIASGQFGDALGLAASIQVTQQGQVKQMQDLLKQV
jgi:uncharacterized protein (DUF305 family)